MAVKVDPRRQKQSLAALEIVPAAGIDLGGVGDFLCLGGAGKIVLANARRIADDDVALGAPSSAHQRADGRANRGDRADTQRIVEQYAAVYHVAADARHLIPAVDRAAEVTMGHTDRLRPVVQTADQTAYIAVILRLHGAVKPAFIESRLAGNGGYQTAEAAALLLRGMDDGTAVHAIHAAGKHARYAAAVGTVLFKIAVDQPEIADGRIGLGKHTRRIIGLDFRVQSADGMALPVKGALETVDRDPGIGGSVGLPSGGTAAVEGNIGAQLHRLAGKIRIIGEIGKAVQICRRIENVFLFPNIVPAHIHHLGNALDVRDVLGEGPQYRRAGRPDRPIGVKVQHRPAVGVDAGEIVFADLHTTADVVRLHVIHRVDTALRGGIGVFKGQRGFTADPACGGAHVLGVGQFAHVQRVADFHDTGTTKTDQAAGQYAAGDTAAVEAVLETHRRGIAVVADDAARLARLRAYQRDGAVKPAVGDGDRFRASGTAHDAADTAATAGGEDGVAVHRVDGALTATHDTAEIAEVVRVVEQVAVHQTKILQRSRFADGGEQSRARLVAVEIHAGNGVTLSVKGAGKAVNGIPGILRRSIRPVPGVACVDGDIRTQLHGLAGEGVLGGENIETVELIEGGKGILRFSLVVPAHVIRFVRAGLLADRIGKGAKTRNVAFAHRPIIGKVQLRPRQCGVPDQTALFKSHGIGANRTAPGAEYGGIAVQIGVNVFGHQRAAFRKLTYGSAHAFAPCGGGENTGGQRIGDIGTGAVGDDADQSALARLAGVTLVGDVRRAEAMFDGGGIGGAFHRADQSAYATAAHALHVHFAVKPAVVQMERAALRHAHQTAGIFPTRVDDRVAVHRVQRTGAITHDTAAAGVGMVMEDAVGHVEIFNATALLGIGKQSCRRIEVLAAPILHGGMVFIVHIQRRQQIGHAVDTADGMSLSVKGAGKAVNRCFPQILRHSRFPVRRRALVEHDVRAQTDGLTGEVVILAQLRQIVQLLRRGDGKRLAVGVIPRHARLVVA